MDNKIKNILLIISGKGGVGKSTVATNLAIILSDRGLKVGLLDADIHGPSLALMLGAQNNAIISEEEDRIFPVKVKRNLSLVSMSYFIPKIDSPIIWRGPMKMKVIEKFIKDVIWEDLDWLIVDSPPGTGDEPLSIAQLLPEAGAVIVTTPQDVSLLDSRKAINFTKSLKLKVYGLIENMSGLRCPHCGEEINLFKKGGGEKIARQYEIPFLGAVPIDPKIVISGDEGNPIAVDKNSSTTKEFMLIVEKILAKK